MGQVRWKEDDVQTQGLEQLQKSQNKLLRLLNSTKIKDKVSTNSMLIKHDMLSVNQINAQIIVKILNIYKSWLNHSQSKMLDRTLHYLSLH